MLLPYPITHLPPRATTRAGQPAGSPGAHGNWATRVGLDGGAEYPGGAIPPPTRVGGWVGGWVVVGWKGGWMGGWSKETFFTAGGALLLLVEMYYSACSAGIEMGSGQSGVKRI